jgi:putative ABC transport system permease protein
LAIIAIIIACLGLVGLSSFSTLQRAKELALRKVLDASAESLFGCFQKVTSG